MLIEYRKLLIDHFTSYVKIDTQSDDSSKNTPSTEKQFNLAHVLKPQLEDLGLSNIELTDKCYLTATLPSNSKKNIPGIGFISHMDTSPDMSGANVKPIITENYNGESLLLNRAQNIILDINEFPVLKNYKGQTLITTDGTTLLGADNKAGIAEIITAITYLTNHPEFEHGDIHIGFTPDEEIGRGADFFDVPNFGALYAYTIDSGEIGSLEYETFNAAGAKVLITGKNVHPGYAKDIMVNAQHVAMEFNNLLPQNERPEHTEGYEGFYHLIKMNGEVEKAELQYIVRDHDKHRFAQRKNQMQQITDFLNHKYKTQPVKLDIKDQYYNMREKIEQAMSVVELAKKAYLKAGIQPNIHAIRGGTDGARLSFMGLPTPNIFTGAHNFHSRFEFIPVESMLKTVEVIVNIARMNAEN